VDRGNYWGHDFIAVAVPMADVPGLGWRSFCVGRSALAGTATGCSGDRKGKIENEFFAVEVEQASGAIVHLVDKRTGIDFVPPGRRLGVLEYFLEAPHPMTAWIIGQIVKTVPFLSGATVEFPHAGPHVAAVRAHHKFGDSRFALTISLARSVPRVDFNLEVDWLERGSPELGVPMLRVAFPLALTDTAAAFECANGYVTRSTNPKDITSFTSKLMGNYFSHNVAVDAVPGEVPAQKWVDLIGAHPGATEPVGAALLNDAKYGHHVDGNVVRLTLLRSSYDPDPLPELGHHTIRFALQPHTGAWTASDATRAGYAFNLPFNAVGTGMQKGKFPARKGCAEILTPNICLSGMKKAEDGGALIVRLYEMDGKDTTARIKLDACLVAPETAAVETDIMERRLKTSTAKMARGTLSVKVPAFGMVTVKLR
jgi:alpha-mannosidase